MIYFKSTKQVFNDKVMLKEIKLPSDSVFTVFSICLLRSHGTTWSGSEGDWVSCICSKFFFKCFIKNQNHREDTIKLNKKLQSKTEDFERWKLLIIIIMWQMSMSAWQVSLAQEQKYGRWIIKMNYYIWLE